MFQVTIAGRVGKNPELRRTQNNEPVLNFSVASDVGYGNNKITLWIECSVWGKRAEALSDYIRTGDPVTVVGQGNLRLWESQAGKHGATISCRVSEITLQGGKRDGDSHGHQEAHHDAPAGGFGADDDLDSEIPF